MADPFRKKLVPINKLQNIRGVDLPVGLTFVQLLVTGPPGVGKTFYIKKIHGWPNEGYIDLTRKGWWKDKTLIYRPREIHLGLPFEDFPQALTVFDSEWKDAEKPLRLQLERIQLPPEGYDFLQSNWRQRYIFEFLLPKPDVIFKQRQERKSEGYFPVDEVMTLDMVKRQVAVYQEIVLYLHRVKMQVYIREALDQPPMCIVEEGEPGIPAWATATSGPRPSLTTLDGWKWLILRRDPSNWLPLTDQWQHIRKETRISFDGNPFELKLGSKILRFYPEMPLGVRRKYLRRNWLITDPSTYGMHLCRFTRVCPGETVMIGRSNEEYQAAFAFDQSVAARHITLCNIKGDIIITPLTEKSPVEIIQITDVEREDRVAQRRYQAMRTIRRIYGGGISLLPPDQAIVLLKDVNALLEQEAYRPENDVGKPGGLIELPNNRAPIIVGDLHAQVNNLLKIITENRFLAALEADTACLIILGDAVHSEVDGEMEDMDSSILMMDLILRLKQHFPKNLFYLKGNHDTFSESLSKNTISQGLLMRRRLQELRGEEYVAEMERFYSLLAYVICSDSFIACHAGPSRRRVTRNKLINLHDHPKISNDLINSRLKRPHYLAGYTKSDVKHFRKNLGLAKHTPFIVGHTPIDPSGSVWRNVADIKGHHIICSSNPDGPSLFEEVNNEMISISYPAEPLIGFIERIDENKVA
ncbi:MAG: metallophosphoesterase [Candidatus Electrothrix sp. Rat3]|nr:metallophosphoesterase [Candidatus Electrothrix rattekaaiensis]